MASAPGITAPVANGITDQNCNGNNASVSALQRINSYLHNTLDLRAALSTHPTTNGNNNSIDSLWSDLVSGNTDANRQQQQNSFSRAKSHSVNGNNVDMQSLSQLLNGNSGGNSYQNYNNGRCTPRVTQSVSSSTSNGANIFNYTVPAPPQTKDDSTSSNGSSGVAVIAGVNGASPPSSGASPPSITSPFSYASPSKANRMNNVSDPGSPSLDDAIMMGIQRQHRNANNTEYNSNNSDSVTLAHLMGSLNMNNCSGSRNLNCSGQLGMGTSDLPNLSGLNSTFNTSNNYMHQGLDFSHLAPYQGNTSNSSWRGAHQNRGYDPNLSGSLGNNSYNTSNYHNGSSLLGSSVLSSNNSTLDMLSALERGAPLSSFLTAQDPFSIEKAAKMHRTAAAVCEATCTWSGQLPVRIHKNPFYSMKVFLGGVPWDVTEPALRQTFMHFGNIQVEWPGKENSANPPKGYVYILFDNEKQVKNLLAACSQDFSNGGNYYFKMSSRRMRQKEVQVIPWVMSDSNYVRCPSYQLDAHKTVFIGALHGMLSAEALANIMNDLFSGVVYAGIDTDKHKYPIGSGRITFNNLQSYRKAVRAAFVEIKTPKFTKKVQIDPYLADSLCQICGMQQGPYFCRDETCFKYFCRTCWLVTPNHQGTTQCHKPLMRNSKLRTQTRLTGGLM